MSKIGLIIKREYSSRVKKKSFIIMTILVPILAAGFLIGAMILGMPEDRDLSIKVIDDSLIVGQNLHISQHNETENKNNPFADPEAHLKSKITYKPDIKLTLDEARALLDSDQANFDMILYIPENILVSNVVKLYYKEMPNSKAQASIMDNINETIEILKVKEANMDYQYYKSIKTQVAVHTIDNKSESDQDSQIEIKAGIGFALGLMIYMFIFIYGVQVMKGVIEEKTNRIVEVIVSSVKPFELMMGKIIGIMLVGLTQFAMWVVLIGIFSTLVMPFMLPDGYDVGTLAGEMNGPHTTAEVANAMGQQDQVIMQDNEIINFLFTQVPWGSLIAIFLFFFIGGYLLYGSLMAAIGAAVDSETDTQQFMLPVTLPLVFAYLISVMGMQDPNSTVMQWCSQIPFTSPVVMLVRYSANAGEGMTLSLITSMLLLIVTFIGTTWLAGKIYRTGILMYGKKVTYKELFKWLKY
ncbi:MAG: ABC transporter permease [Flavobacteriales bacterium]|nr:ABC transporter permease [Flavobacteriales bacterium]